MARYPFDFTVDGATAVALVATTPKTIAQVKFPTNGPPRICITGVHVGSLGVNTTDAPILVEFYYSDATPGTFTAVTAQKRVSSDPGTITNYVVCGKNASGEPTSTGIKFQTTVHPQTSRGWEFSLYREYWINKDATAEQFNVRLTAAQAQNVFFTISGEL